MEIFWGVWRWICYFKGNIDEGLFFHWSKINDFFTVYFAISSVRRTSVPIFLPSSIRRISRFPYNDGNFKINLRSIITKLTTDCPRRNYMDLYVGFTLYSIYSYSQTVLQSLCLADCSLRVAADDSEVLLAELSTAPKSLANVHETQESAR